MNKKCKLKPAVIAVACAFGPVTSSFAADAAPTEMTGEQTLPSVVVSARKPLYDVRDVNLGAFGAKDALDIPMSVQSYSAALIENQHAHTLTDVTKNDPSVQNAAVAAGFDNISIRGFETDFVNTMRRDGLSVAPFHDIPLENVERIDVLKGPAGFLYGYNSPGGTINYVLKRPTAKSFVSVLGELRSYGGRYAHLDAGGKFSEDSPLGYRVNIAGEKVGDFRHGDDVSRGFVSGALDWKINRDALLRVDVDAQNKDVATQPVIGPQSNGQLPPLIDSRTLLGQPWLQYKSRSHNVGTRLDYALNDHWSVTAQLTRSYNKRLLAFPDIFEVRANGDIVRGRVRISPDQTFEATSGQVFATGNFSTGSIGHELVTGVSSRQYTARDAGFIILPITVGNILNPVYSPEQALPAAPAKNLTENRQSSLFVSDMLRFSDSWQAIFGLRHIRYTNDFTRPAAATVTYQQNTTVPSAGIMFKPAKALMTYASVSQGLEQGGIAPPGTINSGETMKPVKSTQIELGAKAELPSGLTLGAAVYEIEKALQYTNTSNVYVQDGRQRHRGLELTAGGDLNRNWSVVAGLGIIDSVQLDTGDPRANGKRGANVPRAQASLFADYRVPTLPGLSVNGGIYYVGARPLDSVNTVDLPAYTRLDLGTRYVTKVAGQKTTFRAQIENLADKRYWAAASFGRVYPGQPRSLAVSAQVEF